MILYGFEIKKYVPINLEINFILKYLKYFGLIWIFFMSNKNKRLLILGGNPETGALVDYANRMGVCTIVIDPNPVSPAKKIASESYDINVIGN